MIIYQPNIYSSDRVVWYGGDSTQLHYEKESTDNAGNPLWFDCVVKTLGNGIPAGMSDMYAELSDFYNECQLID